MDKLFGLHTYTIPGSGEEFGQLRVLYGDNGCGKTTILRMIRHALSPEHNRGHRTALQAIPFKRFEVELANGTSVVAERSEASRGPFTLTVSTNDGRVTCDFPTAGKEATEEEKLLYERLRSLNLNIYYIPDSRRIETSDRDEEIIFRDDEGMMQIVRGTRTRRFVSPDKHRENEVLDEALGEAISRASWWIRRQVNRGSEAGSVEANTIYTEIARRLATYGESQESSDHQAEMMRLKTSIDELVTINTDLARLGLSPNLGLDELLSTVQTTKPSQQSLLSTILTPYVTGIRARFDALAQIQQVLSVFIGHLNSFFVNKRVSFDLGDGLKIIAQKRRLSPASLSSGERQLLLILCSALSARDDASIFIIDEPELSLNVKWQRMFLGALLDCVEGSAAQFLLASHSIELLTRYKEQVTRLRSEDD